MRRPLCKLFFIFMGESSQAVIFDFDGIFFRKGSRWKIINARIGISGSLMTCEKGLEVFENVLKTNPDANINDYFIIEEYAPDTFPANGSVDITPIEALVKTAENHLFRGRDLYILSTYNFSKFSFIIERIFEKYRQFPLQSNPFEKTSGILSLRDIKNGTPFNKIDLFRLMLKYREDLEINYKNELNGHSFSRYNKIFYYHTQADLLPVINDFINAEKDLLLDGKNSLIPSYISNKEAITVS